MEKYSSKNNRYRVHGKFIKKSELTIGREINDIKYNTKCSKFYKFYDECLKDTVGDLISCKEIRKRLELCEKNEGMHDEILKKL